MSHQEAVKDRAPRSPEGRVVTSSGESVTLRQWWLWAVVAAVFFGAAVYVWDEHFKYKYTAKRFGEVVPNRLYRSGQISKWMIEPTLRAHRIGVVIDMNGLDRTDVHQQAELAVVERLGIEHHRFPLAGDGTGDITRYADAIAVIARCDRKGVPVLVHCHAGVQRAGGVVACYRLLVLGDDLEEVLRGLRRYGWTRRSNEKLLIYLDEHMQQLAGMLVERGVIETVPDPLPRFGEG
ncbi:MAG: fused DSP-PTPase phosphatase/NAD kinase-like protein [Planctomycetaceae bacterium]